MEPYPEVAWVPPPVNIPEARVRSARRVSGTSTRDVCGFRGRSLEAAPLGQPSRLKPPVWGWENPYEIGMLAVQAHPLESTVGHPARSTTTGGLNGFNDEH
jgi:hypothetical protein